MSVYAGPTKTWINGIDTGKLHASTKLIVQTGLVYNLDAGTSSSYMGNGTTWTDLKNNDTLSITGSPTYSSTDGSGSFNYGGFQYAVNGSTTIFDNVFSSGITISAWIKVASYGGYQRVMSINGTDNYHRYFIQINDSSGVIQFGDAIGYRNGSSAVGTNVWVNIAATSTYGTSTNIYLNGVDDGGTNVNTISYVADLSNINVSRLQASYGTYTGTFTISNLQIYNRALSAAEIQQNFNALRGRFGV